MKNIFRKWAYVLTFESRWLMIRCLRPQEVFERLPLHRREVPLGTRSRYSPDRHRRRVSFEDDLFPVPVRDLFHQRLFPFLCLKGLMEGYQGYFYPLNHDHCPDRDHVRSTCHDHFKQLTNYSIARLKPKNAVTMVYVIQSDFDC